MGGYALGGRFTTLEGLLINIKEQVATNPLLGATTAVGDSAVNSQKEKIELIKNELQALIEPNEQTDFTIILDDPAGNSYIQVLLYVEALSPVQMKSTRLLLAQKPYVFDRIEFSVFFFFRCLAVLF